MINLHLFSTPGENDIRYVLDVCRPYLEKRDDPLVAYLPLASLSDQWQNYTEKAFKGLARVVSLNAETSTFSEMESVVRQAHVLYVPGGNTFLLAHRLNVSRWMAYLRKKIQAGLPFVGFSAGAILCGPNILTSRDMNMIPTAHFEGLNLVPYNIFVHSQDVAEEDDWLSDFHIFQPNPVILLADGAGLKVENKKITLQRGDGWLLRKGNEKEKLLSGQEIRL